MSDSVKHIARLESMVKTLSEDLATVLTIINTGISPDSLMEILTYLQDVERFKNDDK